MVVNNITCSECKRVDTSWFQSCESYRCKLAPKQYVVHDEIRGNVEYEWNDNCSRVRNTELCKPQRKFIDNIKLAIKGLKFGRIQ